MTLSQARPPIRFNPFSTEFRRDPYPVYRALRETRPVHKTLGMWVLTRHADARTVLHDKSFSAGLIPKLVTEQARRLGQPEVARIERLGRTSLVFTDNPEHARLRGLVNKVFTARTIATLEPLVAAVAERLLRPAVAAGGADAIADLAAPLPVAVLCEWMALPTALHAWVGGWTHDIRFLLEPGLMKAEDLTRVRTVVELFADALAEVLAERRARPGADLISRLLAARTAGGDHLTDEELIFVCIMCFVAGTETTKSLIGTATLALLRHPDQAAMARRSPERLGAAVAEALRYDTPLQLTKRQATRDVAIGGETIRAGDHVLVCLGAANRDPEMFARPDEFDITRTPGAHLAFGHGMHGCLGGALAELQTRIALDALLRRHPRLTTPHAEFAWQEHSFLLRGLAGLPMSFGASR
ncbi:cytochrome P450 [Nocardia rhizosphaerihabitans]|uniref:cytochrome P450 n=1 Tax=Nocardia rhizosphaerihabitans TaxID=1691570 RepID=UPI00366FE2B8